MPLRCAVELGHQGVSSCVALPPPAHTLCLLCICQVFHHALKTKRYTCFLVSAVRVSTLPATLMHRLCAQHCSALSQGPLVHAMCRGPTPLCP